MIDVHGWMYVLQHLYQNFPYVFGTGGNGVQESEGRGGDRGDRQDNNMLCL